MRGLLLLLLAALMVLPAGGALADDWTAVKLRGAVLQMVDGGWEQLQRGDVVPDDRLVKTESGRITLVRGAETIELGPNTQIQIFDKGGRRPFTTVREHYGTVSVEAEVKQVQHFAVQTPFLVAVVKGTKFTVRSGGTQSDVKVARGAVEVQDADGNSEMVLAGQSAKVTVNGPIEVRGLGLGLGKGKDDKAKKDDKIKSGKDGLSEKLDKADKSLKSGGGAVAGHVVETAGTAAQTVGNVVNGIGGGIGGGTLKEKDKD